jgi:hypothetical protein
MEEDEGDDIYGGGENEEVQNGSERNGVAAEAVEDEEREGESEEDDDSDSVSTCTRPGSQNQKESLLISVLQDIEIVTELKPGEEPPAV